MRSDALKIVGWTVVGIAGMVVWFLAVTGAVYLIGGC